MASRRDQVDAYRFARSRLLAAVLRGSATEAEDQTRRASRYSLIAVVAGVLALGVMAFYGLVRPGDSHSWRKDGAFVIDKDAGGQYVYLKGQLHPVLNAASALLLGEQGSAPVAVSDKSLRGAPRGLAVGITGAPDTVPAADRLTGTAWSACSGRVATAGEPQVIVSLGPSMISRSLNASQAFLVSDAAGDRFLLWQGLRLRIGTAALSALGYGSAPALPVADNWLNTVPEGPDLGFPAVPSLGTHSSASSRLNAVGQVAKVASVSGARYYVLLADGLAPISETTALLLVAEPRERSAYGNHTPKLVDLGPADVTASPVSKTGFRNGLQPSAPPSLVTSSGAPTVCSGSRGNEKAATVTLGTAGAQLLPSGQIPVATRAGSAQPKGVQAADLAYVPPGEGALLRAIPNPASQAGTVYLVTDEGIRYPIQDADSLARLGYQKAPIAGIPARVVDLLPVGPSLSSGAAGQVAS